MKKIKHIRDASNVKALKEIYLLRDYDLSCVSGINAAITDLNRAIPDYINPAFHGSGLITSFNEVSVEMFNRKGHDFPAMLLAAICGYRNGTEAVALSSSQLELAISLMSPAESCEAFQHPNIAAWRRILKYICSSVNDTAVIFFVGDENWNGENVIIQEFLESNVSN